MMKKLKSILREIYLKTLQKLCRREMRNISDVYPHSRKDLVRYHDMMAMECCNCKTDTETRLLGISIKTAHFLGETA